MTLIGQATYYKPYFEPSTGGTGWLQGSGHGAEAKLLRIETGNGNHEFIDMYTGLSYNPASGDFGSSVALVTREGTKYSLDTQDDDAKLIDRNGNWLQFNNQGITSSTGRQVDFVRDTAGRITKVIAPDDSEIEYHYSSSGELEWVEDRLDQRTSFDYEVGNGGLPGQNEMYLLNSIVDALGRTTSEQAYDSMGRLEWLADASGTVTNTKFDRAQRTQTVTTLDGGNTTVTFDRRGNVQCGN